MGWVLYHVKRFWMIRVSGLHFIPHLRSPWLTGELTRPANVRLENESQSGPQVDRHSFLVGLPPNFYTNKFGLFSNIEQANNSSTAKLHIHTNFEKLSTFFDYVTAVPFV